MVIRRDRAAQEKSGIRVTIKPHPYRATSSLTNLRNHLARVHSEEWVVACQSDNIKIYIGKSELVATAVQAIRERLYGSSEEGAIPAFSLEAFADALIKWITTDDLAFNAIESPRLRLIFMMLRPTLRNVDIPHRQFLRDRAIEMWESFLASLSKDMKVCLKFH
jgi:hypothetical protein